MYRLSKDEYSNLLQNAITSKYKKTDKCTATNINKEGIKHARCKEGIKHILQNINKTLSKETKVNEWKNTESVINWFKSIPNKHLYMFLMFGIKDFYPSIKEKLLWETIIFAKLYICITKMGIEAIFHARKSRLYYNDEPWVKKGKSNFDVFNGRIRWGRGM